MVTTLRILGDEQLLPIDADTRAALGIDAATPLNLRVEAGRLVVEPAEPAPGFSEAEVDAAIALIRETHEPMLRKLAE